MRISASKAILLGVVDVFPDDSYVCLEEEFDTDGAKNWMATYNPLSLLGDKVQLHSFLVFIHKFVSSTLF